MYTKKNNNVRFEFGTLDDEGNELPYLGHDAWGGGGGKRAGVGQQEVLVLRQAFRPQTSRC